MLSRKELRFERRSILASSQLRAIEKFPREFLNLYFSDYGDGILSGMDYIERDDEIFLTAGILKLNGQIYFSDEVNLSALAKKFLNGNKYFFVLSESERENIENVITEKIFIEVKEFKNNFDGLEFGNFSSQLSFKLPNDDAKNLFAEFTNRNRINLLNVKYSVRGGETFHPIIFRAILKKLTQKKNKTPFDSALMIHLANFSVATISALKIYVEGNGENFIDDTRETILSSIISAIESEWKINLPQKNSEVEKILSAETARKGFFIEDEEF